MPIPRILETIKEVNNEELPPVKPLNSNKAGAMVFLVFVTNLAKPCLIEKAAKLMAFDKAAVIFTAWLACSMLTISAPAAAETSSWAPAPTPVLHPVPSNHFQQCWSIPQLLNTIGLLAQILFTLSLFSPFLMGHEGLSLRPISVKSNTFEAQT
ncbi:hypothetical protein QQP08_013055 [Theobroma cacao]|nr:hypothetical protein QQP08_013055 [Theobroma cacao]